MNSLTAVVLGFIVGIVATWFIIGYTQPDLVATNTATTTTPVAKPLTCEQKIDKLTKEYVAVQNECAPVATSTRG